MFASSKDLKEMKTNKPDGIKFLFSLFVTFSFLVIISTQKEGRRMPGDQSTETYTDRQNDLQTKQLLYPLLHVHVRGNLQVTQVHAVIHT